MVRYPLDTDTLNRTLLGFDRVFKVFDELSTIPAKNYPPYNIRKINDTETMIEVAVAGFTKNEIDITLENGSLTVKGLKKDGTEKNYLYKGIADRTFIHSYKLADTIVVKNASIMDGILYILLENIIPEERKPRKIEISEIDTTKAVSYDPQLLMEKADGYELAAETAEKL